MLNADFPSRQFALLSVALSLVGRGAAVGQWSAATGGAAGPSEGAVRLVGADRYRRVFFVKDALASIQLELAGLVDEKEVDALVVVADEEPALQTRSPRTRFGRDGRVGAGRFNVARALSESSSADDMYEAFKLAGGF